MRALLYLIPALLLSLIAGCGGDDAPPRGVLEISGPEGLRTTIGGKTFQKNPQRLRLVAKRYLVKCAAPGHRDRYYLVDVARNDRLSLRAELEPENSAALIESEPAGAQVFFGGAPLGTTPTVIADLPVGEHKALLKLPGYADREVKWRISDARPVLVRGLLEHNTGVLIFESVPAGARILIDGVESGVTPRRIERAEGRYRVRMELAGCIPAEQTVTLKRGGKAKVRCELAMKPARLTVESEPQGAEIFLNGEKRGVTPCVIENLSAGSYLVRAALPLHEAVEREIKLVAGSRETVAFRLASGVGSCRVVVRPAGVALTLNGAPIGTVKPLPGDRKEVSPVMLRDLTPGSYRLGMSHPRALPTRKEIVFTVSKGQESSVEARMWVPDCEIVYLNGESRRGILIAEDAANLLFGMEPGVQVEVKRSSLRSMRWLPTHEVTDRNGGVRRGIIKAESPSVIIFETEPGHPIEFVRSSLRGIRRLREQE